MDLSILLGQEDIQQIIILLILIFENKTIGIKYKERFNQTLPGPTDYLNLNVDHAKGGTIGRSKRLLTV